MTHQPGAHWGSELRFKLQFVGVIPMAGRQIPESAPGVPYSISRIFALGTAPMDLFTTWPFLNTNRVGMLDTP